MKVKKEVRISYVKLENGISYTVGGDYGDGIIFDIEVGDEFEKMIKDWKFEDLDGNSVPTSEVKLVLHMRDGEEGWSSYITGDGREVIV